MLCDGDGLNSPRPSRLLKILLRLHCTMHLVHSPKIYLGLDSSLMDKLESKNLTIHTYQPIKNKDERSEQENKEIQNIFRNKDYERFFLTKNRDEIFNIVKNFKNVDLIIVENITILIHALRLKNQFNAKLAIDLREFYPLEYENIEWQNSFGAAFNYLCKRYLKYCDICFSVNESLAKRYKNEFNINCDHLLSLPDFHNLDIKNTPKIKKVLYHGFISPDRDSFNLIEIFKNLENFHIDILALSNFQEYLQSFSESAKNYKNINILEKIPMNNLVSFGNNYDIGILTLQNNSFNNSNALPNKFFEYLQSRLCIISTPTNEIKKYINLLKVGFVSQDFNPQSMKRLLLGLTESDINYAKNNSNKYAKQYSIDSNISKVKKIFSI